MQSVFFPYQQQLSQYNLSACGNHNYNYDMQSICAGKTTLMGANRYRDMKCTDRLTRIAERYIANCTVDDNYFHRNQKDIIDCLLALAHALSGIKSTQATPTQKKIEAIILFFKKNLEKKRIYKYIKDVICHQSKDKCQFDEMQFDLLKPEEG